MRSFVTTKLFPKDLLQCVPLKSVVNPLHAVLQVEALQAQIEEQTKLAKEQVEGLMEDRRVKIEEAETRRQREEDKVSQVHMYCHHCQFE